MTHQHTPLRSGMTAIAAVLALSATAAFAQDPAPAADPAAPMIQAPPPPLVVDAPAPAIAEPTTSDAAAPLADAPAAPAPVMATRSTPVVHTPEAAAAERASTSRVTTTRTTTTRTTSNATPAAAPRTAAPAAPAPAPAPVLKPATPPAPATVATTTTRSTTDYTPWIVGGAVALLAVGAGIYAFSRRRRDDEDELVLATEPTERVYAEPVAVPAYAAAAPVIATRSLAESEDGEVMTLANGYDLSRYARHTRAAYRGPTEDNPSLSLKKRLHRASFFDQREREAIERGEAAPLPEPQRAAAKVAEDNEQIVVRPRASRTSRFFGSAFQR